VLHNTQPQTIVGWVGIDRGTEEQVTDKRIVVYSCCDRAVGQASQRIDGRCRLARSKFWADPTSRPAARCCFV